MMDAADAITIFIFVFLSILTIGSVVALIYASRKWGGPQDDPQLRHYLASRGYAMQPSRDPRPPTAVSAYPDVVFGSGDIEFALIRNDGEGKKILYGSRPGAPIGTWWCAPRGAFGAYVRAFITSSVLITHDANYDAWVETFGEGPDGPSSAVRALLAAFPGGLEMAGWYEGRAMVKITGYGTLDSHRLDAAFALLRALTG